MNTLKLRELTLSQGAHKSPEEGVCVMEVVSYIAGETFSDHPECACPVMSAFLRSWNDALDDEGRQMLKEFVPMMVNSRVSSNVALKRQKIISDWCFRVYAPAFLDLAGLMEYATNGRNKGKDADWTAARIAAWDAAWDASLYASWDASWDAAGTAALAAAGTAARAAAWTSVAQPPTQTAALEDAVAAARAAALGGAQTIGSGAGGDALNSTVIALQKSALQLVRDCLALRLAHDE